MARKLRGSENRYRQAPWHPDHCRNVHLIFRGIFPRRKIFLHRTSVGVLVQVAPGLKPNLAPDLVQNKYFGRWKQNFKTKFWSQNLFLYGCTTMFSRISWSTRKIWWSLFSATSASATTTADHWTKWIISPDPNTYLDLKIGNSNIFLNYYF